ncbi:hypothetical protein OG884_15610 [Streptosporangium sp. NBC_01755]|uniref:hypothetical protein n=1 Tax=Streptosporangium sp. NBC_01755 TaxID=2975949 RepID=UPI002DDBB866|nr:hypothetical protein [Streptosporangium sp. NBC_01755]WSD03261.1 hypothetical protein OG884_15610 [Streptosporangium sp. NBC_01755]
MVDVLDLIIRVVGVLTLAVIAFALVALLVIDQRHRRRGLQRPAPGPGRERPWNW